MNVRSYPLALDWDRIWRRLFADAPLSRRRHYVLQHYTIAVLSGLATTLMLEVGEVALRPAVLGLLKQTLARELARGSPSLRPCGDDGAARERRGRRRAASPWKARARR